MPIEIEDDPDLITYWTAIPEVMRWVVGDPIGDPISVDKFRDAVERNMAEVDRGVEWDDESRLSDVVGIILTDDAETTASSLAIDLEAAAIYEDKETGHYLVCGSNVNSDCPSPGGFFPWVLVVISEDDGDDYHSDADNRTDYSVSEDAARWTPRVARSSSTT
jgi:hypothetical protein